MNRSITNIIRFMMDEFIPPILRDNKYFMYPFFYIAFRGRNIELAMEFKKKIYHIGKKEYDDFYNTLNAITTNRPTDLNKPSLDYILNVIDSSAGNLIDVGCGKGYVLKQIRALRPELELFGCDIKEKDDSAQYKFISGSIEQLPFEDRSFDVVICAHTLEHILNFEKAIAELKRITRKQLIIAVPCQQYFYYSLDLHINFFPFKELLVSKINMKNYRCEKLFGDWVYVGNME